MRFLVMLSLVSLSCDRHLEGFLPPDHPGQVCIDLGFCQGLGDPAIQACQGQAAQLRMQAVMSGCAPLFDDYYECADSNYDCRGNIPLFPGCEAKLSSLKSCLAAGAAHNACGQLDTRLAACHGDGGAGDGGVPPPCVGGSVCVAQCYLSNIVNVCAPLVTELSAVTKCAQTCQL